MDPLLPGWTTLKNLPINLFGIETQRFVSVLKSEKVFHTIYHLPEDKAISLMLPISRGLVAADELVPIESPTFPKLDHVMWFESGGRYGFLQPKGNQLHYVLVFSPTAESTMLGLAKLLAAQSVESKKC